MSERTEHPHTNRADIFPETLTFEVPVTGNNHKHVIGEFYGMARVIDALEAVPEAKRTPGFSYALAIAQAALAEGKAEMMGLNLRTVAAAGHDINRLQRVDLKGQMLVCTPRPPGEEQ